MEEKGKGRSKKGEENEGRRAKASRGHRPLRLFSGRRKPPLLVLSHDHDHDHDLLLSLLLSLLLHFL